jgi:hypothetical protein
MNMQWILSWPNMIYVIPFGLALLYLATYTLSGWTFGDADADADHELEADHDFDAEHDFDADHDIDADADADTDMDADAGADAEHEVATTHDGGHESAGGTSPLWTALSFLGVGRIPLSIVLMILLLVWGSVGFMANQISRDVMGETWRVVCWSLPIAAIASVMATNGMSRAINRFMPLNLTFAKRRHELLGSVGEVILPVNANFGMASVRDEGGDLFQVPCRLETGQSGTVPKGARVKLVAYSANETLFYVRALEPAVNA